MSRRSNAGPNLDVMAGRSAPAGDGTQDLDGPIRCAPVLKCPRCGRAGIESYTGLHDWLGAVPGTWSFLECEACALLWLNPRPLSSEFERIYRNYYTHMATVATPLEALTPDGPRAAYLARSWGYRTSAKAPSRLLGSLLRRSRLFRNRVAGEVMWLPFVEGGRLLDVGCGDGRFLARMRHLGWSVVGVELDPAAAARAVKMFGLDIRHGSLTASRLPDASFHAITLNHVIEHVEEPVALLRECRRLLKPDGRLVAVTPNVASAGRRRFGRHWRGLEPPRHFRLFSDRSLREAAADAGLTVESTRTTGRGARAIWLASSSIGNKENRGSEGPGVRQRLQALLCGLKQDAGPHGEELLLIGRRPM